tara:strand:+ start:1389 stop:1649 length:261 start_codon:yes stop_codon:yes gene_type:complete
MHDNAYVDSVVIDVCKRTFRIVSDQGHSQIVQCDSTKEFMDVLGVCHDFLLEDEIEYSDIVTKPKTKRKRKTRTRKKPTSDSNEKV